MSAKKTLTGELQAMKANNKDAQNANNAFKAQMSSGTKKAGDAYRRNKQ